MRGRGIRIAVVTVCVLSLSAITGSTAVASVGRDPGSTTVTLAGHRYTVHPYARSGVKAIGRGIQPAVSKTLAVRTARVLGVVSPKPRVYLVFWGSQWSSDPAGAAPALQNFFKGLFGAPDTFGTILTQYCEGVPAGTTDCTGIGTHVTHPATKPLAGVWFDNATAAPSAATAAQIAAEAVAASTHFGNTSQKLNVNAQYVIASATQTHPDAFPSSGFCAWHDFTTSVNGNLAYTNLPYVPDIGAGGCTTITAPTALDGYFSTETHEYAESVTDLWPSRGWLGAHGNEIADECEQLDARLTLSTGTFDVQGLWSNQANRCVTHG